MFLGMAVTFTLDLYADISFGVIHDRAKRPRAARRSEVVNNSAVGENSAGGRPASARSRSYRSDPQRIKGRIPGGPEGFAKTSNRTKPQEGHYISSMDGRAKGRQHQKKRITAMNNRWLKIIHKMWMDRTPYNAELHHLNQVKHGSWVFQFKTVNCK